MSMKIKKSSEPFSHHFVPARLEPLETRQLLAAWFVNQSASNDSDANPGTSAQPFSTIQRGIDAAGSGDVVYVGAGEYSPAEGDTIRIFNKSNLRIEALSGTRPLVRGARNGWAVFRVGENGNTTKASSHIEIKGFEIAPYKHLGDPTTGRDNTTSPALQPGQQPESQGRPINEGHRYASGIDILGGSHHITITNNIIRDMPASAIGTGGTVWTDGPGGVRQDGSPINDGTDYITIQGNLLYNNLKYAPWQHSAISLYGQMNTNSADGGWHNVIQRNIIHSNTGEYLWGNNPPFAHWFPRTLDPFGQQEYTDSNGIIIDLGGSTQPRTLIENNLIYNNGGRGIHVFKSDNVTALNNTLYKNGTIDPGAPNQLNTYFGQPAELSAGVANNVTYANNLVYGRGDRPLSDAFTFGQFPANTNIVFDSNQYFHDKSPSANTSWVNGINDIFGDPKFANASHADFRRMAGGVGIDQGNKTLGRYAWSDFNNVDRFNGGPVDPGAYEFVKPVSNDGTAYGSGPAVIGSSGGVIYAERFNNGGQGVAYNDTDPQNRGGLFRTERVDIGSRSSNDFVIGWTASGEWLKYTLNVTVGGLYNFNFITSGIGNGLLQLELDGSNLGPATSIANTGNWNNYQSRTGPANVYISPGQHVLRVIINKAGFNLDLIQILRSTATNLVANGNFSNGGDGWNRWGTNWNFSSGAATSNQLPATANFWDVGMARSITLAPNRHYRLVFKARSLGADRSMIASVSGAAAATSTSLWNDTIQLKVAYRNYSLDFITMSDVNNIEVKFFFGQPGTAPGVQIDDVSLVAI